MSKHPGGSQLFLKYAGTDCTKNFNDARHIDAYNYMDDLCIGKVKYCDEKFINKIIKLNNQIK